jgi:outer membrane protein assembly factor BamB
VRRSLLAPLAAAAAAAVLVACGGGATATATPTAAAPATPTASAPASTAEAQPGDWLQFDYDSQRNGVGPADTGITAANLHSLRTRIVHIAGTVDSSAVELQNVAIGGRVRDAIFLTTTYGQTLAIDPGTGQKLWEFTPSDLRSYEGSAQITTATPTIDPNRRYLYAASPDGFIHKLSVTTGQQVTNGHWPVRVTLLPQREKIASPPGIDGSNLIVATDGYNGDTPPYQGHVLAIDRATGRIEHVWNTLCSNRHYLQRPSTCPGSDSAIWGRSAPVIEPGSGRILIATGNGPFNGRTDWGDSVLELAPDASRLLHNWTPTNQEALNDNDWDLGSTAPALLPEVHGYRLAVQGGKEGVLDLLNLDRLDGTSGPAGPRTGGQLQQLSAPGGGQVKTAIAVWSGSGRVLVFVADDSGTDAYTISFRSGRPRLVTVWQNGTSGTSPIIAGGLLYVYDEQGGSLDVYAPRSGRLLRSLPAQGGHWSSPIAVDGRVILPTGGSPSDNASSTELFIYHLPGR